MDTHSRVSFTITRLTTIPALALAVFVLWSQSPVLAMQLGSNLNTQTPSARVKIRRCRLNIVSLAIIRRSTGNYQFRFRTTCPSKATISFGDQPPISLNPPRFKERNYQPGQVLLPNITDPLEGGGPDGQRTDHSIDVDLYPDFKSFDYYIVTVSDASGATAYKAGAMSRESLPDVTTRVGDASRVAAVATAPAKTKYPRRPTAPTVFEMRCRGGAGLIFSAAEGRQLQTGETMMNMTINFIGGTQAVDGDGTNLKPGQCSWLDRGLSSGEPSQFRLEIVSFAQLRRQLHGDPVDTSPTAAERYPDAQNVPTYLRDSNHYWSFFVYNTNQGYFQVTSNKYWRPLVFKTRPGQASPDTQRPTELNHLEVNQK